MNHWIEVTGKTEEEAIAAALEQLGKERDEVSVELLERAKTGFLGIGSSPAKIRVTYTEEQNRAEKLEAFLLGLLERMHAEAVPKITETPEGNLKVVLEGSRLGALIGRRGETLDAIQQISNYAVNRGEETRVKVHIDAENYRQKREESLQRLAVKVAEKVIRQRRNVMLEPMNAYERHVIHSALQDWDEIATYSTGNEPNRRIVVAFSKGGPKANRA
ncbi:MAG: protein jag [Oscillospiraceae bacterium]|nr:protein jag [Oscillospiraceae bacterium]